MEREVAGREIGDGRSAALPSYEHILTFVFYYGSSNMRYKPDGSAHSVFALYYHLVVVVKYRRKALYSDDIRERLKDIVWNLSGELGIDVFAPRTCGRSLSSSLQGDSKS